MDKIDSILDNFQETLLIVLGSYETEREQFGAEVASYRFNQRTNHWMEENQGELDANLDSDAAKGIMAASLIIAGLMINSGAVDHE
jgi:hypothetical protein